MKTNETTTATGVSALNQFDFYSVKATSKTIRPLIEAGISRNQIRKERIGWECYGRKRFPRTQYTASVGFAEANGNPDAIVAPFVARGLNVRIEYHARD